MKNQFEIMIYEQTGNDSLLSIEELCRFAGISSDLVSQFFRSGLIDPLIEEPILKFDLNVIPRIRKIERLRRDLGVNLAGVGIVLDLLERITELENELQYYKITRSRN